ncbi:hypothetical protein BC834DRAFT_517909 [Gloeopeniophorella convolvens]|nr:hypothetical protein BC834DRAFT_517909 [Gloeopeniophorella convolvens]
MQASPSTLPGGQVVKYTVRSSDVLSENRVNVTEENSDRIVWYKERFLTDDEIVEHVVENTTSTLLWEIHKPLRGWYIRLRSPAFSHNVFIPLLPVPSSSSYHTPGSLKFSCRTHAVAPSSPGALTGTSSPPRRKPLTSHTSTDSEVTLTDVSPAQPSPTHTYPPPPTPPSVVVSPPSPTAVHAKLDQLTRPRLERTRSVISQFILAPHAQATAVHASGGIFARALRALRNNVPASSNSFSLSPLPDAPPAPVLAQGPVPALAHHHLHLTGGPIGPPPLLVFHDTTPVFSVASSTGVLEVHLEEVGKRGVDLGFWIAVALAYGEFLGDRDGYLAAATD